MPFSTKIRSSYSKSYKFDTKQQKLFFWLTVHKYEASNVDFNLFLNCCKLGNGVISLAKPLHMCIPLTVIDSSLWVVLLQCKPLVMTTN